MILFTSQEYHRKWLPLRVLGVKDHLYFLSCRPYTDAGLYPNAHWYGTLPVDKQDSCTDNPWWFLPLCISLVRILATFSYCRWSCTSAPVHGWHNTYHYGKAYRSPFWNAKDLYMYPCTTNVPYGSANRVCQPAQKNKVGIFWIINQQVDLRLFS